MQMFINNNARFCSLCIWKVSSPNILEEFQYVQEKIKTKNDIDEELKPESDTDTDTDTNNEK